MPQAVDGTLRKFALRVPEVIYQCSGIMVFGKRIKSLVFSTDLSIIKNVNADAIIAVYPFTPQPIITQALLLAADIPVFAGVGGGLTQGQRVVNLAMFAEMQGATGVVLNAPTASAVVSHVAEMIDIPVVLTVARADTDFDERIKAGADIFNVSAAAETPAVVRCIREQHPDVPIIATGGPTDESILETIRAGANAITWTPPSNGEIFRDIMAAYREQWAQLGTGVEVPAHVFLNHIDPEVCNMSVDILTSDDNYVASELWRRKEIHIDTDAEMLAVGVPKAVTLYKSKVIERMSRELREKLQDENLTDDEMQDIMQRLSNLNRGKVSIARKLHRLIL